MTEDTELVVVLTTVASEQQALALARALLERRLAACVQIGAGVTSLYHWRGGIERAEEWPLLIKTRRTRRVELEQALVGLHPYEVPECLAFDVDHASPAYAQWVLQETV